MRHFFSKLIALPLLPFLVAQGKCARRITLHLPEAAGPASGIFGSMSAAPPITLLTIGESPVASVGVATHVEAITGRFAKALSSRFKRPAIWRAYGRNGVTMREACAQIVPDIPEQQVDIALVAFSVNDTTAFNSVARWRSDLSRLLEALEACCVPRLVVLSGVPPIKHFPALPQPCTGCWA